VLNDTVTRVTTADTVSVYTKVAGVEEGVGDWDSVGVAASGEGVLEKLSCGRYWMLFGGWWLPDPESPMFWLPLIWSSSHSVHSS
jgi:hypothetical protein